jgi:hypothetical protein
MSVDVEAKGWLAVRKLEALKIDPDTADVRWDYAQTLDPYGVANLPEEFQQVGREYFARRPGSDIWIWFGDLPERTRSRLWELRAQVFPQGFEALERCIAVALAFGWQPSGVPWGANVASEWSRRYLANDCCLKVDGDNARAMARALFRALDAAKMSQSLESDQVTPLSGTSVEEVTRLADFASAGTFWV